MTVLAQQIGQSFSLVSDWEHNQRAATRDPDLGCTDFLGCHLIVLGGKRVSLTPAASCLSVVWDPLCPAAQHLLQDQGHGRQPHPSFLLTFFLLSLPL